MPEYILQQKLKCSKNKHKYLHLNKVSAFIYISEFKSILKNFIQCTKEFNSLHIFSASHCTHVLNMKLLFIYTSGLQNMQLLLESFYEIKTQCEKCKEDKYENIVCRKTSCLYFFKRYSM